MPIPFRTHADPLLTTTARLLDTAAEDMRSRAATGRDARVCSLLLAYTLRATDPETAWTRTPAELRVLLRDAYAERLVSRPFMDQALAVCAAAEGGA